MLPNTQTNPRSESGPTSYHPMGPSPLYTMIPLGFNHDLPPPFEDATLRHGPSNHGVVVLQNVRA